MDGFNAVQKQYLATCLRICSTPELYKINNKRIHVDAMTNNVEVIFSKEYRGLLDLCDKIGAKGDKKHAKRESKSRLKHKYY